jgi:hypothetical protein
MIAQEKRKRIAELKEKIDKTKADYDRAKAMQLALKLVINGTYGAFAHPKFVLSNSHIANAITAMGRDVIQYMLDKIENYFYKEWHLDKDSHEKLGIEYIAEKDGKYYLLDRDCNNINYSYNSLDELKLKLNFYDLIEDKKELNGYNILYRRDIHDFSNINQIKKEEPIIIYGDTDSVAKDTIIKTNNGDKTIEDFYNENIKNGSAGITLKGHESVSTKDKVFNYDENKGLYYTSVKRIIRHKVSKPKWKLKTKLGKEIIVTNDHSMIVFRNGKKLEVKPSEILKSDKILIVRNNMGEIEYYFDDIESCEMVGEFENEYVYDIEVDDDTHTFIGNDILVHNSLYVSFTPIIKSSNYKGDDLDFILHLDRVVIKSLFTKYLEEYANKFGVSNLHDFELETINRSALHIQKKHYINNVAWEDGIFYENLSYFYPKGVEIVKSSTPPFVRENIYEFLRYVFSNPNNLDIRKILLLVKDLKKQFMMADIEDISMTTSCSNYNDRVIDDVTDVICVKGAHFGVKAAALHNYLLNKNSEYKIKYDNIRGGRIKYYYCNHPKNDIFGYMRSMHPYEIVDKEGVKIDYDEQFDVSFLSIINRFLKPIGLPTINKRLSVLNSIFQL